MSMKYFGHPHTLKLHEISKEEGQYNEITCTVCEQSILSYPEAYTCTQLNCTFILHKSCSEIPERTMHKFHPEHPLVLISEPHAPKFYYDCNACGGKLTKFSFVCENDSFRIHPACANLPQSVVCKADPHPLYLHFDTYKPGDFRDYDCDACGGVMYMSKGNWWYYCKECDFGTHVYCTSLPPREETQQENNSVEEAIDRMAQIQANQNALQISTLKAMNQMAISNFQVEMAKLNARNFCPHTHY